MTGQDHTRLVRRVVVDDEQLPLQSRWDAQLCICANVWSRSFARFQVQMATVIRMLLGPFEVKNRYGVEPLPRPPAAAEQATG